MDVAKYIGLFLLKNEQCYVHGLGTLQLVRKSATYDGQFLHGPSYEIVMTAGGNVDDSLANFIATNEQTSITKAANALKEYSAEARAQMQQGVEVSLPHLGRFYEKDGRIGFATNAHLQYKSDPIEAKRGISLHHNERPAIPHQPYIPQTPIGMLQHQQQVPQGPFMPQGSPPGMPYMEEEEETKGGMAWGRLILIVLVLLAAAAGTYYAYTKYLAPKPAQQPAPLTVPDLEEQIPEFDDAYTQDTLAPVDSTLLDTTLMNEVMEQAPVLPNQQQATPVAPAKMMNLKVVINTYDSRGDALKRKNQLNGGGRVVNVVQEDTNYFFVTMMVKTTTADTARVLDSMSRKYNPDGVFPY